MTVNAGTLAPDQITLVGDFLTKGSTTVACANLLQERFPDAIIRIFAMMRTQGLIDDIANIVDPAVGTIIGHDSGRPFRDP